MWSTAYVHSHCDVLERDLPFGHPWSILRIDLVSLLILVLYCLVRLADYEMILPPEKNFERFPFQRVWNWLGSISEKQINGRGDIIIKGFVWQKKGVK